jgi:hypothetical protein
LNITPIASSSDDRIRSGFEVPSGLKAEADREDGEKYEPLVAADKAATEPGFEKGEWGQAQLPHRGHDTTAELVGTSVTKAGHRSVILTEPRCCRIEIAAATNGTSAYQLEKIATIATMATETTARTRSRPCRIRIADAIAKI